MNPVAPVIRTRSSGFAMKSRLGPSFIVKLIGKELVLHRLEAQKR